MVIFTTAYFSAGREGCFKTEFMTSDDVISADPVVQKSCLRRERGGGQAKAFSVCTKVDCGFTKFLTHEADFLEHFLVSFRPRNIFWDPLPCKFFQWMHDIRLVFHVVPIIMAKFNYTF